MPHGQPPFSVMEGEYVPAYVETVRIVNVNIDGWSVDAISEYANKRFFDIQVMNPYFHFANGEGFYAVPEVGALAWLCWPSSGRFSAPFLLGYQAPFDEQLEGGSFRAGRLNLNPGDMMMRTRDENFVILRRGGVVQIGAGPIAQTVYVPIRNMIRNFCENWELFTFGGELTWSTDRDDQTTDGASPTKLTLKAKDVANQPAHVAELTIGSHGDGEPTKLELKINESSEDGAPVKVQMSVTNEGDVNWNLEKSWSLTAKDSITHTAKEGDISQVAEKGNHSVQADQNVSVKATQGDWTAEAGKNALIKAATQATVDSPKINLGNGANQPIPKGNDLATLLKEIITVIDAIVDPQTGSKLAPTAAVLKQKVSTILSSVSFTK